MTSGYGGKVLRMDWYGEAKVSGDGTIEQIPSTYHRMCGTCLGEYDRRCGRFESSRLREKLTGKIKRLPAEQIGAHGFAEFCCLCGAEADVEAIFELENIEVCDGLHSHDPRLP